MAEPNAGLDWVRRHVLTRRDRTDPTPRVCACQYGPCGHCQRGDHAQCTTRVMVAAGRQLACPETWITDKKGLVAGPARQVQVWLSDRRCRWVCPCDCPPELIPGLPPARPRHRGTGGNAAVRLAKTTPRPHRGDEQAPLFELAEAHHG